MHLIYKVIYPIFIVVLIYSCSGPGGADPGTEYMPDMVHSLAYEANYYDYYYYNTWGGEEEYYEYAKPGKPVANTIARGYAGIAAGDYERQAAMQGYQYNGSVPYPYEDTEPERLRATREIITNPYPITDEGMARGKLLYDINCGICHGEKGEGEGYLVSEKNPYAVYPAQPAILTNDTFTLSSNGRLYHAIMYGKNVMGGYADKLSYEERWQVVHYIRNLQAKSRNLVYNETENTLTKDAFPFEVWKLINPKPEEIDDAIGEAHTDDHSGDDHSHGEDGHGSHTH